MITAYDWGIITVIAASVTALATVTYVVVIVRTLRYIRDQAKELRKHRTLQATLAIFKELQTREARKSRSEIYVRVPRTIEGLEESDRQMYLEMAEEALITFDLVGYLVREGYLDPAPLIDTHWPAIWKCWKKTENLIRWAQEKRNDPIYLTRFKRLFELCEAHRRENNYPKPTLYLTRRGS